MNSRIHCFPQSPICEKVIGGRKPAPSLVSPEKTNPRLLFQSPRNARGVCAGTVGDSYYFFIFILTYKKEGEQGEPGEPIQARVSEPRIFPDPRFQSIPALIHGQKCALCGCSPEYSSGWSGRVIGARFCPPLRASAGSPERGSRATP